MTHPILPEIVSGYELSQANNYGYWQIVAPEATTNMVVNPSFEFDTYGWELSPVPNLRFERSSDISKFGAFSVKLFGKDIPTNSYIVNTLDNWQSDAPLTLSAYGFGRVDAVRPSKMQVGIFLMENNTVILSAMSRPLKGLGRWYRVNASLQIPYYFNSEDPNKRIELRLYHGGGREDVLYWDGVQCEQKNMPTTYTDGDMVGLNGELKPYCWLGAPHRSQSTRSASTRSGGLPINFTTYDFRFTEFVGAGLPPIEAQSQAYGLLPGGIYVQSNYQAREIILSGKACADKFQNLRGKYFEVEKLLSPNVATRQGVFKLIFEQADGCCDDTLEIYTAYNGGLEGEFVSLYQSEFTMRLLANDPFFKTIGERGQRLDYSEQLWINHIVQRRGNGQWDNLDNGVSNTVAGAEQVKKVLWIDNKIIAYGNFNKGGNVTLNKLAQFSDESGWVDIFDGVTYIDMSDLDVKDIVRFADGRLAFTAYDTGLQGTGVWTTNLTSLNDCQQHVQLLGSLWLDMPPKTWYTLAVDRRGYLFAAGDRNNIMYYDGIGWYSYLSGFEGTVRDMAFDVDGNLYVVGDFRRELGQVIQQVDSMTLKVLPTFTAVDEFTMSAKPAEIIIRGQRFAMVADVVENPDDTITDYDWYVVETLQSFSGRVVTFDLSARPDESVTEIQLTVTTTSGKELTNSIFYYLIIEDGESSLKAINELATSNKLIYNLDVIKFDAETVILDDRDEIILYSWSNDQTADVSNEKSPTFDFSSLAVADEVVVTLVTTTKYGAINTNSIKLVKDTNQGMIEIEADATDDETSYNPVISEELIPYCYNGLIIAPNLSITCISGLPSAYCVEIGEDRRAYIGARDGLYSFNGESLQKLVATPPITSLAINPLTGEIYLGGQFGLMKWNFFYLISAGIATSYNPIVNSIDFNECDAALAVGLNYKGGARVSSTTQLFYPGSAEVRPSFRFFGPGNIIEVTNYTTQQSLYPQHIMQSGEIVDLSLEHGRVSFRSNFWGNIPIVNGTNTRFFLAKELNDIGLWVDNGATYCTEAVAIFPVKHVSANALCDPERDFRFPISELPAPCCDDGRTFIIGESPLNDCFRTPCAAGSEVYDMVTGEWWIMTNCEAIEDPCAECLPPQRVYVDDNPTPNVSYDCIKGTEVINPVTGELWVLIDCGANTLVDDNGDILVDDNGECLVDDTP